MGKYLVDGGQRSESQGKTKRQVLFFCPWLSILVPCVFPFLSTLWMAERQCLPLEGTEWNELQPDVCFLGKQSSSCLSPESPTMLLFQGRAVSPLYALSVLQEALKSVVAMGMRGKSRRSSAPAQTDTCQNKDKSPEDTAQKWCWTSKWNYGLAIQCFIILINLNFVIPNYTLKCNRQKKCSLHNSV